MGFLRLGALVKSMPITCNWPCPLEKLASQLHSLWLWRTSPPIAGSLFLLFSFWDYWDGKGGEDATPFINVGISNFFRKKSDPLSSSAKMKAYLET